MTAYSVYSLLGTFGRQGLPLDTAGRKLRISVDMLPHDQDPGI